MYEITFPLPDHSIVIADKAYNCGIIETALAEFGITLMPKRRKNMKKQWFLFQERFLLSKRRRIETSFSILSETMKFEAVRKFFLAANSDASRLAASQNLKSSSI